MFSEIYNLNLAFFEYKSVYTLNDGMYSMRVNRYI